MNILKTNFKKEKGITIVVLIIVIIIILILAGISIQTITSSNGLFTRAKQTKEKVLIQEGKEKIELAIMDLMAEKTSNGENLTKEDLTKINSIEIDVGNTNNFPVEVIYKNYKYQVDEIFKVSYVEDVDRTVVTYVTEPEGYTKQNKVKILIKITNPNGIESIQRSK